MFLIRCSFAVALLLSTALASRAGAAEILSLDEENSKIEFVGRKSDGKHVGGFKQFKVRALADLEDPSAGRLEVEIDARSLWSDNTKLTNHLKNPDFFDVRKYPKIVFKSTAVHAEDEQRAEITGQLTMLDETAELTIPCEVELTDEAIELTTQFKLDRTRWGMNYRADSIDKEVEVTAKIVLKR